MDDQQAKAFLLLPERMACALGAKPERGGAKAPENRDSAPAWLWQSAART
ncbi:MAG: hypothetical protein WC989_00890 [Micavibrio sp.]